MTTYDDDFWRRWTAAATRKAARMHMADPEGAAQEVIAAMWRLDPAARWRADGGRNYTRWLYRWIYLRLKTVQRAERSRVGRELRFAVSESALRPAEGLEPLDAAVLALAAYRASERLSGASGAVLRTLAAQAVGGQDATLQTLAEALGVTQRRAQTLRDGVRRELARCEAGREFLEVLSG